MRLRTRVLAIMTATACLSFVGGVASASDPGEVASSAASVTTGEGSPKVSFEECKALVDDLKHSDVPRTERVVDDQTFITFTKRRLRADLGRRSRRIGL